MSREDGHVMRRTLGIVVEGQTEDIGESGCGRKHEQGRCSCLEKFIRD